MGEEQWTVLKVIQWTAGHFQKKELENPRLEAEVLLAHLLGIDRIGLYLNYDRPLTEEERQVYREMIQRRMGGEPLAYIVGSKEFWSLRFEVSGECLIPRPETEHLVEETLRIARGLPTPPHVLEIGFGCGAIAVALAKELAGAEIVATDISIGALALAQANAARHQVEGAVRFILGDLFPSGEPTGGPKRGETFDVICSNPPYIPTAEILHLAPEVRDYEPLTALDGGTDGLHFFRQIAEGAPRFLMQQGWLLMEIGKGQDATVTGILQEQGFAQIGLTTDYAGVTRVIKAQWPGAWYSQTRNE
jgi:release factor glutamine methyltransferase